MSSNRAAKALAQVNRAPVQPTYRTLASVVGGALRLLTKQQWLGGERIPRIGGIIVVSNHISNFDPLVLGHFLIWHGRWPRALGKIDLWRVPVIGWLARETGQIPVERHTERAGNSLILAEEALAAHECVVIYPEGTITADPDGWPMVARPGAAKLAFRTGAPVIPVAQWGANEVMPGKKPTWPRLFPRKTMRLLAGEPVDLSDLAEAADLPSAAAEASVRIMDALTALLVELRGVPAPVGRYDTRVGRRLPRDWSGTEG
ncbi:MAG: lysophospholipid acyltransferase family protein [Micropruina sp.]